MQINPSGAASQQIDLHAAPFVASDGARLSYVRLGDGGRPLLFLHSLGSSTRQWGEAWDLLVALGYHCIGLDFRGVGRSQKETCELTCERLARDVLELAEFLKIPALEIVGHSMGGKIALQVHALQPERVKALVLLGTPGPRKVPMPRGVLEDFLRSPDRHRWARDFFRPWFVVWPRTSIDTWIDAFVRMPEWALWATAEATLWTDFSEKMPSNVPPTLMVVGEDDPVYGPAYASAEVLPYLPDATLHVLPDCGHGIVLENAETTTQLIHAFLARLSR